MKYLKVFERYWDDEKDLNLENNLLIISDCLLETFDRLGIVESDKLSDNIDEPNLRWYINVENIIIDDIPTSNVENIYQEISKCKHIIKSRSGKDIDIHIGGNEYVPDYKWIIILIKK